MFNHLSLLLLSALASPWLASSEAESVEPHFPSLRFGGAAGSKRSLVELVISQQHEDLSWSDSLADARTIYCTGATTCHKSSISLPSAAVEGLPFLHHIVVNYDDLSAWTFFTHAGAWHPTFLSAFAAGQLEEYLTPRHDSLFFFDAKVHAPSLLQARHYTSEVRKQSHTLEVVTRSSHCLHDVEGSGWTEYMPVLSEVGAEVLSECGLQEIGWQDAFQAFWDENVGLPMPLHQVLYYTESMPLQFAISRDRLRQQPKAYYERLLSLLSNGDGCLESMMHFAWYYIFGLPTAAACAATPADAAVDASAIGMATDGRVSSQDPTSRSTGAAQIRALGSINITQGDTEVTTETIWNITGEMHFYVRDTKRAIYVGNETLSALGKAWMQDYLNISSDWLTWTWKADEDWALLLICEVEIVFLADMADLAQSTLADLVDPSFISSAAKAFKAASGVGTAGRGVRFVLGSVEQYVLPETDTSQEEEKEKEEAGSGGSEEADSGGNEEEEEEVVEGETQSTTSTTSGRKTEIQDDGCSRASSLVAILVATLLFIAAL